MGKEGGRGREGKGMQADRQGGEGVERRRGGKGTKGWEGGEGGKEGRGGGEGRGGPISRIQKD